MMTAEDAEDVQMMTAEGAEDAELNQVKTKWGYGVTSEIPNLCVLRVLCGFHP